MRSIIYALFMWVICLDHKKWTLLAGKQHIQEWLIKVSLYPVHIPPSDSNIHKCMPRAFICIHYISHTAIFWSPPRKVDSMTFGVTLVFSVMIINEDYFVDVFPVFYVWWVYSVFYSSLTAQLIIILFAAILKTSNNSLTILLMV
jgi:hypothetical protein